MTEPQVLQEHDPTTVLLPEDLIGDALEDIGPLADQVGAMTAPILEHRETLRQRLIDGGEILPLPEVAPVSTVAVDGGSVVETLFALDMITAVAVHAEDSDTPVPVAPANAYRRWQRVLPHTNDLDRVASYAMAACELDVLTRMPHEQVVADGSHQTFVIAANSAFTSTSATVRGLALDITNEFDVRAALETLCDPDDGAHIIASPKYDSSTSLAERFRPMAEDVGATSLLDVGDRLLTSVLLEPGEMTVPVQSGSEWKKLHIKPLAGSTDKQKAAAESLHEAIDPLRKAEKHTNLGVAIAYAKPHGSATAIKAEAKRSLGMEGVKDAIARLAATVVSPHIQEPLPQHLADISAKSVSHLSTALLHDLTLRVGDQHPELVEYIIRQHRTSA